MYYKNEPDETLVMLTLAGEQTAYEVLVNRYQKAAISAAISVTKNHFMAEDAAQETFVRVYARLSTYDPQRKFSSWILSIASHYCVDRLRRRHGNTVSMEEIMSWRWLPDDKPKPEERTLAHEESATIQRLLSELPDQHRLVIILRYWQDMSYEEIAEVTGSTVSAVKSRLHRAREQMAQRLGEVEGTAEDTEREERRVPDNALSRGI